MPEYKVITESGADYMVDTDRGFWNHRGTGIERIWSFQSAPESPELLVPWAYDGYGNSFGEQVEGSPWHPVTEPVMGERMYLASRDYWRISTVVVSIEEVPDVEV